MNELNKMVYTKHLPTGYGHGHRVEISRRPEDDDSWSRILRDKRLVECAGRKAFLKGKATTCPDNGPVGHEDSVFTCTRAQPRDTALWKRVTDDVQAVAFRNCPSDYSQHRANYHCRCTRMDTT